MLSDLTSPYFFKISRSNFRQYFFASSVKKRSLTRISVDVKEIAHKKIPTKAHILIIRSYRVKDNSNIELNPNPNSK